jgi:hypothetical protein
VLTGLELRELYRRWRRLAVHDDVDLTVPVLMDMSGDSRGNPLQGM